MLLPPPTSTLFPYTTLFRSRPIKKDSIPISANRVQPWPILYLPLQCPTNVRQPFLGGHIPMHGYAQPPLDVPLFLMYTVRRQYHHSTYSRSPAHHKWFPSFHRGTPNLEPVSQRQSGLTYQIL